ncbi:MAG: hypothetical protein ABFS17_06000 [Chloroflexota bacterium]
MKRFLILVFLVTLIIPSVVSAAPAESVQAVKIPNGPKFRIADVDRGNSVTLAISEFPTDKTYNVYLAQAGQHYSDGYKVGTLSDTRTGFRVTYSIPKPIAHQAYISVFIVNWRDGTHGYDMFANDDGYDWREPLALYPVHRSSASSAGKSVGIFQGPTYWVEENGYPDEFILRFTDFYEEGSYTVYVGENNGNFQGYVAGFVKHTDGIQFRKAFRLPPELYVEGMEIKVVVQNAFNSHSGAVAFRYQNPYNTSVTPNGYFTQGDRATDGSGGAYNSSVTPFLSILNVVSNGEVTLQTYNFPPEKDFLVTMGPMGTKGVGGYVIGTQNSGEGGNFIATYPVPMQLYGSDMISIRLESTTSGHYAYDYFTNSDGYNASSTGSSIIPGTSPANSGWTLAAGTYPSTSVVGVVKDATVTVQGSNFTTNDTYTVRMGLLGTQGVGGIVVGSHSTGSSSSFTTSFPIPPSLAGVAQISIRFESDNTPYYAYDWFNNN